MDWGALAAGYGSWPHKLLCEINKLYVLYLSMAIADFPQTMSKRLSDMLYINFFIAGPPMPSDAFGDVG